ncbi:hypothetical protein KP509_21G001000 [Ceratopteris richardii]|uniref:RING-type E3 ubiquitin transferase n=1 Tax=Ceratopteris richardii TaxID=49495 RepID=A0A8T2S713_CERRI|nr:hypothetical protein KP509_21G001000 [Ceratopteris richardii]
MGDPANSNSSDYYDDAGYADQVQQTATISSKITIVAILTLFIVLLFLSSVHLYGKYLWRSRGRRRRLPIRWLNSQEQQALLVASGAPLLGMGLSKDVLSTIPTFTYSETTKSDSVDEENQVHLECSVCLSELQDGEVGRILPACKHVFHSECIDMWFFSHKTCPLCRGVVEGAPDTIASRSPENEQHLEDGREEDISTLEVRISVSSIRPIDSAGIAHIDTITDLATSPCDATSVLDEEVENPFVASAGPFYSPRYRSMPASGNPSASPSSSSSSSGKHLLRSFPPRITIQVPHRQDFRIPCPGRISLPSRRLIRSLVSPVPSRSSSSSPSTDYSALEVASTARLPPPSSKSPRPSLNRIWSIQSTKGNSLLSEHLSPTLLKDGQRLPV